MTWGLIAGYCGWLLVYQAQFYLWVDHRYWVQFEAWKRHKEMHEQMGDELFAAMMNAGIIEEVEEEIVH